MREELPGRLGAVRMDVELPHRADLPVVFDELDYQLAGQAYLWALPLVSYAQWKQQHHEVFGATGSDLVHYVGYRDRLGMITANATIPYIVVPPGDDTTEADGYPGAALHRRQHHGRVPPEGRAWSAEQPRSLGYWERLHGIYQSEVVDERDRFYLAMLEQPGIEKGKPFAPDRRLARILTDGAAAGELLARANSFAKRFAGSRYWPDRQGDLVLAMDNSAQRGEYHDQLLERASWFYEAVTFSEAMKSSTPARGRPTSRPPQARTACGSTATAPTPCTRRRTCPRSCSGPSRSTTARPGA